MADYSLSSMAVRAASTITDQLQEPIRKFVQRAATGKEGVIWGICGYNRGGIWVSPKYLNAVYLAHTFLAGWAANCDLGWSRGIEIDLSNEVVVTGQRYVCRSVTEDRKSVV